MIAILNGNAISIKLPEALAEEFDKAYGIQCLDEFFVNELTSYVEDPVAYLSYRTGWLAPDMMVE